MKLRLYLLGFLLIFGLAPLLLAVMINFPLVLDRTTLFYQRAYLQNLRADFRDLDQHLASRNEMIRLLARFPDPGLILGEKGEDKQIDLARVRYAGWLNQILSGQRDIIQILFVDNDGLARFWLASDPATREWQWTEHPPQLPSQPFLTAGLKQPPGGVMVSRIRVDPDTGADDPRQLMTLSLMSRLGSPGTGESPGAVVMTIDIGGLAQFYRDTLWVNHDGSYLRPGQPVGGAPQAFEDFPGLQAIFAAGKLAVWKGADGQQYLWVPMFLTEDSVPLWVGRAVDPSPIDAFRDVLAVRVFSIILLLVVVVMVLARWIAARLERFGRQLTDGIGLILRDGQPQRFHWRGPDEIRRLGDELTSLSEKYAEHLRTEQEHMRALEQSNRYKTQFLANVSHELRTPLNSIVLLSKMLAGDVALDAAQRRQAQIIHEAGNDLCTMIDTILDISRIEAGRVTVTPEWFEVRPVLAELADLFEPQLANKPVQLEILIEPGAARTLCTDRDKLRQILRNLLANAIKFTAQGHIRLEFGRSGDPQRSVVFRVADTGIGIAPEKHALIFEAFQQADGSTRRKYGGTGLGLSICRELAALLGGRIEVDSTPGQGATFLLSLPLMGGSATADPQVPVGASESDPQESPGEPALVVPERPVESPCTEWVLVIERDARALVRLATDLTRLGLRVQTAVDLEEGEETLRDEGAGCALVLVSALLWMDAPGATFRNFLAQVPEPRPAVLLLTDDSGPVPESADVIGVLTRTGSLEQLVERLRPLLPVWASGHFARTGRPLQED